MLPALIVMGIFGAIFFLIYIYYRKDLKDTNQSELRTIAHGHFGAFGREERLAAIKKLDPVKGRRILTKIVKKEDDEELQIQAIGIKPISHVGAQKHQL